MQKREFIFQFLFLSEIVWSFPPCTGQRASPAEIVVRPSRKRNGRFIFLLVLVKIWIWIWICRWPWLLLLFCCCCCLVVLLFDQLLLLVEAVLQHPFCLWWRFVCLNPLCVFSFLFPLFYLLIPPSFLHFLHFIHYSICNFLPHSLIFSFFI